MGTLIVMVAPRSGRFSTPQQDAAIAPHFRKFSQVLRQLPEDLRGRFAASFRDLNENIARDLTPEQRKELWTLVQERWQRRDNGPRNTHNLRVSNNKSISFGMYQF